MKNISGAINRVSSLLLAVTIISGCQSTATPTTFSNYEARLNANHSGLESLKSIGLHINFRRYQLVQTTYDPSGYTKPTEKKIPKFGDFSFSERKFTGKHYNDLLNLSFLNMAMSNCASTRNNSDPLNCRVIEYTITDENAHRNYLAKMVKKDFNRFESAIKSLEKIDVSVGQLSSEERELWKNAVLDKFSKRMSFFSALVALESLGELSLSEHRGLISAYFEKEQRTLEAKKIKEKQKNERRLKAFERQKQRAKKEAERAAQVEAAKKLINDPTKIGHTFCKDGVIEYIGFRHHWGNQTTVEKQSTDGQMKATLEGLSPDKKMVRLRSQGYASKESFQYKSGTTPSLGSLSVPVGQIFWDNKSEWYYCQ